MTGSGHSADAAARRTNSLRSGWHLIRHPHLLRHSFGTALGQAGVGAVVIQRILGHVDLSTTQRYMHADVEAGSVFIFGGE